MLSKLGALITAVAVSAVTLLLTTQPANADRSATFRLSTPAVATSRGATTLTCDAEVHGTSYVYPEGDAGVTVGANTTCTRPLGLSGSIFVIPRVEEMGPAVCSTVFNDTCPIADRAVPAAYAPGDLVVLRYTVVLTAGPQFTWTTIPGECTVSGPRLTCVITGIFIVA